MGTKLNTAERCALVERNTAEVMGHDELAGLFESGAQLRHYIGFEISGKIHLGTGLASMSKVRDFLEAGIDCTIFLADWHTWINDKLGGDRDVIRRVATGYFTTGMRAALECVGADPNAVTVVLGSELYTERPDFWATVVDVGKHTSLARMQRSITIMGRAEGDNVDFAKLLYPAMQAADVFTLGAHIAHAGMDQRKAHVIARDAALQMRINALRGNDGKPIKPLAVHHPLILGLRKPPQWPIPEGKERDVLSSMKMSKSDPDSAVFIHDSPDDIRRKVGKAFCTPGDVTFNPILDWTEKLVFGLGDSELVVDRTPQNGGPVTFGAFEEVRDAFADGKLHPMDAKAALASRLIDRLEPARKRFNEPEAHAQWEELEAQVAPRR